MRTGVLLQARIKSSRFPGKVLKSISGKPLLEHIIYRLSFLRHPVRLTLVTSDLQQDDAIVQFCRYHSVEYFRGSEKNVLERFYLCAQKYGLHQVVRLTGDNPFVDIEELDRLIDLHFERHADYSHSFDWLPVGSGAEIFTFEALEQSFQNGKKPNHREHVNEYIHENPELFHIETLHVPLRKSRPDVRLTVDTEADYQKACFITSKSPNAYISTAEAIELSAIFENIKGN